METITGGIGMPSAWYGSLPGNPIPHDAYTRPQGGGKADVSAVVYTRRLPGLTHTRGCPYRFSSKEPRHGR